MKAKKNIIIRLTYLLLVAFGLLEFSCNSKPNLAEMPEYDGPLMEIDSMTTLWSDSAVVRVKLVAAKEFEYDNGDKKFPNGVFIEFFNTEGEKTSSLTADRGFYTKKENLYKAEGDVEVISYEKNEQLNTEELFWKPDDQKIYTDKFVRIDTEDELLLGEGLTANQDFSSYKILKPRGDFRMEQ